MNINETSPGSGTIKITALLRDHRKSFLVLVWFLLYGPSTCFRWFRARTVTLTILSGQASYAGYQYLVHILSRVTDSCSSWIKTARGYWQAFITDICNHLGAVQLSSEDPEENWTVFRKMIHTSAVDTLGHASRKHQDWFWREWWRNPLASWEKKKRKKKKKKHCLHKAHQDDTSSVSKQHLKYSPKQTQGHARFLPEQESGRNPVLCRQKGHEEVPWCTKTGYGPKSSGTIPLLSADKDVVFERWVKHLNSVLNRPSTINDNAINRLPQVECNVFLRDFPTVTETTKAIQHLSSGKALGSDAWPTRVKLLVFICSSVPVVLFDTPGISRCRSQHVVSVQSSSLFHPSIYLWFICFPW